MDLHPEGRAIAKMRFNHLRLPTGDQAEFPDARLPQASQDMLKNRTAFTGNIGLGVSSVRSPSRPFAPARITAFMYLLRFALIGHRVHGGSRLPRHRDSSS